MTWVLIKKQFRELFQNYFIDRKTGKVRNKGGIIAFSLLYVFLIVILGFAFFSISLGLGTPLFEAGLGWLYFAIMGLLAIALGVFGSVFSTYSSLYLPKDNDFLLSLPIKPHVLLLARTSGVYITSLLYGSIMWIPAVAAYWVLVPPRLETILFPILLTFALALFVSVLSCILGFFVAMIASKTKGKSFITVILSLFGVALYYVIYFKLVNSLEEILTQIAVIGTTVKNWLHFVTLVGNAATGDLLSFVLAVVVTLLLAGICLFVLSKTYMKIVLSGNKSEKKTTRLPGYRENSQEKALLKREYKHFTSVSTWMLNGGLGLVIIPAVMVALLVKLADIQALLLGLPEPILNLLPIALAIVPSLIISMNAITSASVSMEGRNMWIIQTMPLDPWKILWAKIRMGVQPNALVGSIFVLVCGFALHLNILEIALALLMVLLFTLVTESFGLMLNLLRPNLHWNNAAVVVKQSMPVAINLFGGWIFVGLLGLAGFLLCEVLAPSVILMIYLLLLLALWLLLRGWLKRKGTEILRYL